MLDNVCHEPGRTEVTVFNYTPEHTPCYVSSQWRGVKTLQGESDCNILIPSLRQTGGRLGNGSPTQRIQATHQPRPVPTW